MKITKSTSLLVIVIVVFAAILAVCGCSYKLAKETLPPYPIEVTTSTTTEETTEPEPTTEPTKEHGPYSTAQVTSMPVALHGQLAVKGTKIVDKDEQEFQLKGISTASIIECGDFFNEDIIKTLAEDWGCDVIRFAITAGSENEGYASNPTKYFDETCRVIDMCVNQGIYVIVDWHNTVDGSPNTSKTMSVDFFTRLSAIYCNCPNLIYEVFDEPGIDSKGKNVSWDKEIMPYAKAVIDAIRANKAANIVIVGTPNKCLDVGSAAAKKLSGDNIMYSLHFYAGTHGKDVMDKVKAAIGKGLPIFATEWGTTKDSGRGQVFADESKEWIKFLDENGISWCNRFIGSRSYDSSNALRMYSDILNATEITSGHWPDEFLSESGTLVREMLLTQETGESQDD